MMEKKKYYVNMGTGEISKLKYDNNEDFVIHATDDEIVLLREKLNEADASGIRTFFRAHIPVVPYHNDPSNDEFDNELMEAYRMVYQLGDEQAKSHIESMGILGDRPL
ncbi:hydrolase [Virgibacillus salexigens]|uniref:hydrolase n=1 Tax=Virgibacillus salexigens TaxID=61016 RepID=UPI003081583A